MVRIRHINPDRNSDFTRGTIAVNVPTEAVLFDLINNYTNSLYLNVGASFVHPIDQYEKKVGRARAESLCMTEEPKYCFLKYIEPRDGRLVFHFTTLVPDTRPVPGMFIGIEFGVTVSSNSTDTRLEYANFQG